MTEEEKEDNELKKKLDQMLCSQLTERQKAYLIPGSVYFSESVYQLKNALENDGLLNTYKLELIPVPYHNDWIKMYSVASSSRLCYLAFRKTPGFQFEHTLTISGKIKAHYDAYDSISNKYIECKFHEIATKSHTPSLKEYPYRSFLDKLGFEGIKANEGVLLPTLAQFGIGTDPNRTIYQMHFDFKQLVTHVCGMIAQKKQGTLSYIIFTPDGKYTGQSAVIDKMYHELEDEIDRIKVSAFADRLTKNGIKLEFNFLPVSNYVEDL